MKMDQFSCFEVRIAKVGLVLWGKPFSANQGSCRKQFGCSCIPPRSQYPSAPFANSAGVLPIRTRRPFVVANGVFERARASRYLLGTSGFRIPQLRLMQPESVPPTRTDRHSRYERYADAMVRATPSGIMQTAIISHGFGW